MKANEAPEKLWWSEGAVWHINPDSKRYIEYTRTDAFVEKACAWLRNNLQGIVGGSIYIEDFRRYMGE